MASDKPLENRIADAQSTLNKAFGITEQQEGKEENRFLQLKSLSNAYKEEASRTEITQQFLSMAKSVRQMRSSYLPVDFFINNLTGRFDADLVSTVADRESYENAFMRMLGMPSVGTAEFGLSTEDSEIRSSETLKVVDPNTGIASDVPFEDVRVNILNERQKPRSTRRILIDNTIYNVTGATATSQSEDTISVRSLSVEELADLFDTVVDSATQQLIDPTTLDIATFTPTEISRNSEDEPFLNPYTGAAIATSKIENLLTSVSEEETQPSIENLGEDIWKFSYLLIPPIQNIEISRCINEPDKIVAPPFTNTRTRKVNDLKVRPTLLESVIRIRLDRVSGTDSLVGAEIESDSLVEFSIGNEPIGDTMPDSYGVLESLFILRLRSAISGLAQKAVSDVDIIINEMEKIRKIPATENANTGQAVTTQSNEAADESIDTLENEINDAINNEKRASLQQQKLIEDSILFLLGDNSEALDLQSQTQRNSTIHDAHMMNGLISIIDVPRQRIEKEASSLEIKRAKAFSQSVEGKTQELGVSLGTDIGIGTLDLAVFALALFTISEGSLLGLLSTAQYDRIKNGEFKALLPDEGEKEDTVAAVNELSQLVIDGYRIFIKELNTDSRPD